MNAHAQVHVAPAPSVSSPKAREQAFLEAVGLRVQRARRAKRMSRRLLCEASGVSQRFIAHLEHGEGNISIVRLKAIADALGVAMSALLADGRDTAAADRREGVNPAAVADLFRHAAPAEQLAVVELLIGSARRHRAM